MKISISNIAWAAQDDDFFYSAMQKLGYQGLEIAPTRIFPERPYEHLMEAHQWSSELENTYGLVISSTQSIWYGKTQRLFGTEEERRELFLYTKKAIEFAEAVGSGNLVFGCPRNRNRMNGEDKETAILFFKELGDYAARHNTTLSLEPNPTVYGTNYVNTTEEALEVVKMVASEGFKVNVDLGTIICNQESLNIIGQNLDLVNHIHISEPGLKPIQPGQIHRELFKLLKVRYDGFISLEMGSGNDREQIVSMMKEIRGIFDGT